MRERYWKEGPRERGRQGEKDERSTGDRRANTRVWGDGKINLRNEEGPRETESWEEKMREIQWKERERKGKARGTKPKIRREEGKKGRGVKREGEMGRKI